MTCAEAREALWPIRRPQLVGGRVEEARRHVEACSACQDYLAQDEVLMSAYERLRGTRVPEALRERVFATIARERSVSQGSVPGSEPRARPATRSALEWTRRPWTIAAVGVVALASGVFFTRAAIEREPASGAAFVEDYLRRAVGQERIHSSDLATVRQWLTRELGLPLQPLQVTGLELEGAEICLLEGRRGAMILYRLGGAQIAHYLVPRDGVLARAPAIGAGDRDFEGAVLPLVTWSTPSVEQALVGELESSQLLALARAGL